MSNKKIMSDPQLPPTLLEGASDPVERSAALLLQNAFVKRPEPLHPAVGVRIKAQLARRLEQPPQKERRWLPHLVFAGATALVLGGIAIGQLGVFDNERAVQQILAGTLIPVENAGLRFEAGESLAAATAVSCVVDACEIGILGGVRVVMQSRAVFAVSDQSLTHVHSGRVSFDVEPRGPGKSFAVRAGGTLVEVVGTAFSVEVQKERERVAVTEGTVRVTHGEQSVLLAAGESWTNQAPAPAVTGSGQRPEKNQPAGVEPSDKAQPRPIRSEGKSPGQAERQPKPRAATKRSPQGQPAAFDADRLMVQLESRLKNRDLKAARQICEALSHPRARASEVQLYTVAKDQLEKLDAPKAALRTLATLNKRYPAGVLETERQLLTIRAFYAVSDCERAKKATERYQRAFPDDAEYHGEEIALALEAAGCSR